MARSIHDRVRESFKTTDHEDTYNYLTWLLSTISDYANNLRRTVAVMLALIAGYELVAVQPKTSIAIGSFQISKGSIVLEFIPAIVGYLYLQSTIYNDHLYRLQTTFAEVFSIWSPRAGESELEALVQPSMAVYWSTYLETNRPNRKLNDSLEYILTPLIQVAITAGVVRFQYMAYKGLYHSSIPIHIPFFISLFTGALCTAIGILHTTITLIGEK